MTLVPDDVRPRGLFVYFETRNRLGSTRKWRDNVFMVKRPVFCKESLFSAWREVCGPVYTNGIDSSCEEYHFGFLFSFLAQRVLEILAFLVFQGFASSDANGPRRTKLCGASCISRDPEYGPATRIRNHFRGQIGLMLSRHAL